MSAEKEWVMRRVKELRKEKFEAEQKQKFEREKQLVEWEAQCIFSLENLNKSELLKQYTNDMDVYDCITENLYQNTGLPWQQFMRCGKTSKKTSANEDTNNAYTQQNFDKIGFKNTLKMIDLNSTNIIHPMIYLKCCIDFVNELRSSQEYKDKDKDKDKEAIQRQIAELQSKLQAV
jgi:hypothetical protein